MSSLCDLADEYLERADKLEAEIEAKQKQLKQLERKDASNMECAKLDKEIRSLEEMRGECLATAGRLKNYYKRS